MSRIDDDRDAQRARERQALKQHQEAQRAQKQGAQRSAFAQKVQQVQGQHQADFKTRVQSEEGSRETEATEIEEELTDLDAERLKGRAENRLRNDGKKFWSKEEQDQAQTQREVGGRAQAGERTLAAQAKAQTQARSQSQDQDARSGDQKFKDRGSDAQRSAFAGKTARQRPSKEHGRTDPDDGGGGQGHDEGSSGAPPGFRLNPALMPPVPVARPKDTRSEKLRALANEIAQKIVERVRVGTNREGIAEFQIDLKSSVLSGLSIKLSGSHGRISALFSGHDRQVLKMLQEQSQGLKEALKGRGLTLEEFRVEVLG